MKRFDPLQSGGGAVAFFLFLFLFVVSCAGACEMVLTQAEIAAAGRARAVGFFGGIAAAELGHETSAAGDVNGDGFDDFVIAAPFVGSGSLYLLFGRSAAAWASAQFNFSEDATPDNTSWIRIRGGTGITNLGAWGVAHGDFNGDGFSDLIIGTYYFTRVFVVFGHSGAWSSFTTADIGSPDAPGFAISGGISSQKHASNAGDMNGDGIEDMFVTDVSAPSIPNTACVVFGVPGMTRSEFDINTVDGTNGFSMADGVEYLGYGNGAISSAGDVNGDGLADLVIGSFQANQLAGRAYILFARNVSVTGLQWPATLNLTSDVDGTNGFIVDGPASSMFGYFVSSAGDVNGDGFADVFIGTDADRGAWIVFGHSAPWTSPFLASELNGKDGFHFASSSYENWGRSGGRAGDVNGDGLDDIVIGGNDAPNSTGSRTGAAAILFGRNGSWPAEIGRNDVFGSVGFLIDGAVEGSKFGWSTSGVGDVNGDGLTDFVVGASMQSAEAGYALLVFGNNDHCAVCSNATEECLVCEDGFVLSGGAFCEAALPHSSSVSADVVVVIETGGGGGSAIEVAAEVAQLLGVDVGQISVIEITPGTFEVTVTGQDVAQQLVTLITQCIEDAESEQEQM